MIDVTKLAQGIDWKIAYAEVERHARQILIASVPTKSTIGTTALCEALFPPEFVRGDNALYIRRRIFKALQALATRGLADCATQGPPMKRKFGTIHPWLWHSPDPNFRFIGPREIVEGDL